VITNKHVVGPAVWSVKRVITATVALEIGAIFISDRHDLAAIEIEDTVKLPFFNCAAPKMHLECVITLGYPFVARVEKPVMMAHSGQINGFSDTMDGEQLMFISAAVSPGSSGGPVLNEMGLVIGITTQSNEGQYSVGEGEKQKIFHSIHHAAIPADVIVRFLKEI
jgi:S1-C subfamily serine protease